MDAYRALFTDRRFLIFWTGFTVSVTGDAMTRVALTWLVLSETNSPEAVGLLNFLLMAPIVIGGLMAGWLLDRYDRATVLIIDAVLRAAAISSIPAANVFGVLTLEHVYVVAALHGFLMMIPLAGVPTILPSIVPADRLGSANALETFGYMSSGMIGAPVAGMLIDIVGPPGVLWIDAGSFLLFAFLVSRAGIPKRAPILAGEVKPEKSAGYGEVVRLLVRNPILVTTTLMFMGFNLGLGAMMVWLPIHAQGLSGGDAGLYGQFLGVIAVGQLIAAAGVGMLASSAPYGLMICLSQIATGLFLLPIAAVSVVPVMFASFFVQGLFHSPLTILAQTLRMRIIPPELRGRSFALLRMMMQSTGPIGGLACGFLIPQIGLGPAIIASGLLMTIPALGGLLVGPLRRARPNLLQTASSAR
ncbi:MAG: MFS transporter [Rhodospirillaceae bacterium]|nr:MFS transporter [Rhodospirillaceae bacterium]